MLPALTFAAFTVTLDGRVVLPRARAAVTDGHVLLPVRALGNALGADVGYDGRARTITVQRGAHVATISARGAVRVVNGKAYAPLRAVATAFGLGVGYDARTRTVALGDLGARSVARSGGGPGANGGVGADARSPYGQAPNAPALTVMLKPSSGAEVHEAYPAISARFAGAASIDPRSLRVVVDGNDVTAEAAVIGDQVVFTPRSALAPGTHSVSVTARDARGTPLAQQWSFVDTFAFVSAPPPMPFPITAIWIDRWITPGTNSFNVYVEGAPGITGFVGVEGVGSYFPLQVYTANAYVAHVYVPNGVNQPFAHVAARVTLPNGDTETIGLPQTVSIITQPLARPTPTPMIYQAAPRRPLGVPTSSPTPLRPRFERPTAAPTATPASAPASAGPSLAPTPVATRGPIRVPLRARTPAPSATTIPLVPTAAPAPKPPATTAPHTTPTPHATPTPRPTPVRTRAPLIRRPSPTPEP